MFSPPPHVPFPGKPWRKSKSRIVAVKDNTKRKVNAMLTKPRIRVTWSFLLDVWVFAFVSVFLISDIEILDFDISFIHSFVHLICFWLPVVAFDPLNRKFLCLM